MGRTITSKRLVSGVYDFDVDAGATGTIGLGVHIPNNSVITAFYVKGLTLPTSGGSATVSVGWTGDIDALMVALAFGNFIVDEVRAGRNFAISPVTTTASREVAVTIGTADLTAGKFQVFVEYIESDL